MTAPKPDDIAGIPLEDLPLFWQGRANALRTVDSHRTASDIVTLEEARVYEECATELRTALTAQQKRIAELEVERDEALQLTESCSTLKEMASACIDGAVWKVRAEKAEAERDTIEAATIERCMKPVWSALKAHDDALQRREYGDLAAYRVVAAIRALAKGDKP
jgi:hypothetical protein